MKRLGMILFIVLFSLINVYAEPFISYQGIAFNSDDDNFKRDAYLHAIEAGYSWKHWDLGIEGLTGSKRSGWKSHFRETSIMITAKAKFPIKNFIPYGVFGLGASRFTHRKMNALEDTAQPERLYGKRSIAVKYGGGIEYKVFKKLSIFAEVAYRYSDTGKDSSLDSWGWGYGAGIKGYF